MGTRKRVQGRAPLGDSRPPVGGESAWRTKSQPSTRLKNRMRTTIPAITAIRKNPPFSVWFPLLLCVLGGVFTEFPPVVCTTFVEAIVTVGETLAFAVGVSVATAVGEGVGLGVGDGVGLGVGDGVGLGVGDGVGLGVGVGGQRIRQLLSAYTFFTAVRETKAESISSKSASTQTITRGLVKPISGILFLPALFSRHTDLLDGPKSTSCSFFLI